MSNTATREAAKKLVKILENLPEERIKHIVSFKDTQLERFRNVAGLESSSKEVKKPTLREIKDIISRTSGPLGLKKDMMKRVNSTLLEEQFTVSSLEEQVKSLTNIVNNKYKNHYDVGKKLYEPVGNPRYYSRLLDELTGRGTETFFTALRTVIFGK
ncbi:Cbp6p Ecym_3448 [Eremothecium cymbalariae DBVPG|uniref:Uncharacterized protein n=1 Tax=Eremothecium cymbalariae (strain CBS 270.75 / DBVPG 7215 / KCTC 17166 / NRRL Y-17582) TaxID=931890 RepID=G8JS14_ERECY|nr:Hypothetical protein Ecym_3448 [Eremothecium cymbalariae DBVPG\